MHTLRHTVLHALPAAPLLLHAPGTQKSTCTSSLLCAPVCTPTHLEEHLEPPLMPSTHAHCQKHEAATLPPSIVTWHTPCSGRCTPKLTHTSATLAAGRCQCHSTCASGAAPTPLPLPATAAPARCQMTVKALQMEVVAKPGESGDSVSTAPAGCLRTRGALNR